MPIVLRHNPTLELSRVEYTGIMRAQDLHDHAAFNASYPVWLGFDCISVIHGNVDVSAVSLTNLDGVFTAHRQLFEPLNLMFMRRSGWVCESPAGQRLLSHWLTKRNADKSPWADIRQFDSFEALASGCCSAPKMPRSSKAAKASTKSRASTHQQPDLQGRSVAHADRDAPQRSSRTHARRLFW